MRSIPVAIAALMAAFGSTMVTAQVMQLPRPTPDATAAGADWQLRGEPIFFAGNYYYPVGPNVFFDGFAMVRSGDYQGIPVYTDPLIEPYSIVYVPIGRNVMRPYERRRAGELAGTIGSRTPSFPIERDGERLRAALPEGVEGDALREAPRAVGIDGGAMATTSVGGTTDAVASGRSARPLIESIPVPRSNAGIWLEFNGARWYSVGRAVPHIADKFVQIGTYRGLIVYRAATGRSGEIFVPSVADGPLAAYARR